MTTIKTIDEFEDIRKSIMRLHDTVKRAALGAELLDDKVRMHSLDKKVQEIDRVLKLQSCEIEDAIAFAKNTKRCNECRSINQL